MDRLTHLSLFSGIGGLDLAAEWAGFRTVGQCEWAEYPAKVLEKHWPGIPRWKDIRTLTGDSFYERTGRRTVDIISGGFPCQPFSVAGKQRGKEDDRYLWPEMVRVIKELRPAWVVGENVAGIVRMALPDILSELEACGYRARAFLIPACAVGARHRRYRVAIVGYSEHNGLPPAEITGSIAEAGRGQQERKENACEFTGTGRYGHGQNVEGNIYVANAESVCKGRLPFREEQADARPAGSCADMADTQGKGNGGLSICPRGPQQENTDIEWCSEDVQYPDCTGRKEQYNAKEPAGQGFHCGGCNEGNVCHPPGKGLADRAGKQVGGYRTQEQEPERPGSNVPDTDNRGRTVRWDGELPAAEETGSRWSNYGDGAEEHGPGKRGPAQPGLGGMADGFPGWVDGYWDIEPDIPRVARGIPHRTERLKALGNAVVPQQFYPIFKAIAEAEKAT